jgi:sugar/nucleoside kinase (ribokinase family)
MKPLNYKPDKLRYRAMIGTGGIGGGSFFMLNGNHTLGREESRSGHFLDQRDYCKLHIIAYYVKILLGEAFPVFPIGKVGRDDMGANVLEEMQHAGLDTRFVAQDANASTLNSICFLYPDGTGGNLTVDNSASDRVDAACIDPAQKLFARYRGQGIVLAAPEVPLPTRKYLLEKATTYAFYRAASFVASEMDYVLENGLLKIIDLIGLNLEEAAAFTGGEFSDQPAEGIVNEAIQAGQRQNPDLVLSITAGINGSWLWDGKQLHFTPAISVPVKSSAGAGDAHLAGLMAAAALGLEPGAAAALATLIAAISVTSPHTIHPQLDRTMIQDFRKKLAIDIPDALQPFLED